MRQKHTILLNILCKNSYKLKYSLTLPIKTEQHASKKLADKMDLI